MSKKTIKLPTTEYKISAADFVTVNDVLEEPTESLADIIAEAYKKALKEDIKANTVIIDEHFAKVNAFSFVFGRDVMHLPPMICGLEIQVSDELPDGYDFAVLEVPETERELLVRKAKAEAAVEIFEEIEELFRQHKEGGYYLNGAWFPERLDLYTEDAFEELKKKYTEGEK